MNFLVMIGTVQRIGPKLQAKEETTWLIRKDVDPLNPSDP